MTPEKPKNGATPLPKNEALQLAIDFINELLDVTESEAGDIICNNGEKIVGALEASRDLVTEPQDHKLPRRMWINQPSTLQPDHNLNGTNVLAMHEYDDTYRVYFLSGPVESQQIPKSSLSDGWTQSLSDKINWQMTLKRCPDNEFISFFDDNPEMSYVVTKSQSDSVPREHLVTAWKSRDDMAEECTRIRQQLSLANDANGQLEARIVEMREAIRAFGGHIPNCAGRPCTCGFQSVWEKFTK